MTDEAPAERRRAAREDDNATLDEHDDDWAWRRRLRSNPAAHTVYRVVVFVIGLVLVLGGLALVPLPGPGWLIVIVGLAVWASEFERAQVVLDWVKAKVRAWTEWVQRQAWWLKGLIALATAAFVATVIWVTLHVSGVPGFLPSPVKTFLVDVANLPGG